jgi:predicted nucleic acid-binding protein
VVRVPGYTTQMYCDSCEVLTEFIYVLQKKVDRLCGLVVRVPGYTTQMYCVSCEVRTEFIYVLQKKVDRLCGLVVRVPDYRPRGPGSFSGVIRFSEK